MQKLCIASTIFLSCFMLINCKNELSGQKTKIIVSADKKVISDSTFTEVEPLLKEHINYLDNKDIDGDKISDYISLSYTGGAHCCYKVNLKLSSMNDTIEYPFEIDGGYGFGIVDGSYHDQFDIDDYDNDGLPEIFIGISTYNGEKYPINSEWTTKYGVKSHYIIFDFKDGKLVLEDYDKEKHIKKTTLH